VDRDHDGDVMDETYLQAKVQFLAQQLSQAIDALCDAAGNVAVWKAKVEAAQARVAELEAAQPTTQES
jgi:hypothetical protein